MIEQVGSSETKVSLEELQELYFGRISGKVFENHKIQYNVDQKRYPTVNNIFFTAQKRILVTGGAGFVGSHLVDRLMKMGHLVTVLDNFLTGHKRNIEHWLGHPHFELIRHDVVDSFMMEVDEIYHLACPASPRTICLISSLYDQSCLAKRTKARFLLASTSEIYGDPQIHPQKEDYWGNVNTAGPRILNLIVGACYDEGKRAAETLTIAYGNQDKVEIRIVRIFNTYGPRMNPEDGRVVSNFIMQCLKNESMKIYGDGQQTRSFMYVHDLVDGLILAMGSDFKDPINIGNPQEYTIKVFAELVREKVKNSLRVNYGLNASIALKECEQKNPIGSGESNIEYLDALTDDPKRRKPDIELAKNTLGWEPKFSLDQGLSETIEYFKLLLQERL